MRTTMWRLLTLSACLVGSACSGPSGPSVAVAQSVAAVEPASDDERLLYALGQALGRNITSAGLTEDEIAFVQQGLIDSALGREALVDLDEYGPRLEAFMQQRQSVAAEAELELATAFLQDQAGRDGAETTASGIVIEEMTAGTGPMPTAEDTVRVHYHGTLRDGTVFDSSVERGEPATFPLGGVIACWTEGVQHIAVGGKARLVCPPDLAYGAEGRPGIPGNAALAFEVELLEIVP